MTITPIPTRYAGCWFRSRLEARWAVFLDTLGIRWEYEPQGFENRLTCDCDDPPEMRTTPDGSASCTGHHKRYLPDFFLSDTQTWVEVKGSETELLAKAAFYVDMLDYGGQLPHVSDTYRSSGGLLILGPIPHVHERSGTPLHTALQHSKGIFRVFMTFTSEGLTYIDYSGNWPPIETSCSGLTDEYPAPNGLAYTGTAWIPGRNVDPDVRHAYRAARSARFEHGEKP